MRAVSSLPCASAASSSAIELELAADRSYRGNLRLPPEVLIFYRHVVALSARFGRLLAMRYRVSKIIGDHYGGEFVKEPFRKNGISYTLCKQSKSDLFRDMLPLLNSGHVSLPRHDRLIAQIVGLERRVSRAPADSIDLPGAHDRHRQRR